MREHILLARQESAPVLEEAATLLARKHETEAKQQLLDAFRQHFVVPDEDLTTLTSSFESVNDHFFTVMGRVKQIHNDCEILLGYENQRLGLELMEQTTRNLDAGFKKLYTWVQREFKGLDLEDPHISASIRRALRVLSERPVLFQNCLRLFAETRQSTLSEAFHMALTDSSGSAFKAIEFSTHDPLRYIGDMLAWVHSATVSEREALEGLFISDADDLSKGLNAHKATSPWAANGAVVRSAENDADGHFDAQKALNDLVSRSLFSVCQTLQHRVQVAARHTDSPILTYKIYNLLSFYQAIFVKLVGTENNLTSTIEELESSVLTHFEDVMDEETTAANSEIVASANLASPPSLTTALQQFCDIVRVRGAQITAAEFERLFSVMLTTILNACAEAASSLTNMRRASIYRLNYLLTVQTTLNAIAAQVPAANAPLCKAESEIESLQSNLVEGLTTTFLDDSGVVELLQEIDSHHDPASRRQYLLEHLDSSAQKLDDFLSGGLMDAQESIKNLTDKNTAKHVISEAVERFCTEFDELRNLLDLYDEGTMDQDAEGEGLLLQDLYPRTSGEVRALLS